MRFVLSGSALCALAKCQKRTFMDSRAHLGCFLDFLGLMVHSVLKRKPGFFGMGEECVNRRLQQRNGSYVVTIPLEMIRSLGMKKGQNLEITCVNGKMVIKPTQQKTTKKDLVEADRATAGSEPVVDDVTRQLDEAMGKPKYVARKPKLDNRSRLEKLKMK